MRFKSLLFTTAAVLAAGAANAEDDDAGLQFPRGRHAQIDTHVLLQGYKLL